MRVAHVVPVAKNTPWFADICAETVRQGHEVVAVIHSGPGDLAERLTALGIRHHRVAMHFGDDFDRIRPLFYLLRLPIAALKLARILRRERIEVAHSHVFVANVVARLACLLARVKHVAGAASPRHLEAPATRRIDRAMRRLDAAVAAGCEYIARLYGDAANVHTIYYGPPAERFDPSRVDAMAFRRQLGVGADVPLVGLVAHFYPPMRGPQAPPATRGVGLKGHDHFLAAARIVAERFPEARFFLVGAGPNARGEEYRQSLVQSVRGNDRILFPGHRNDIANVLASFDVAVQCALTETLGGTIEALLMERPLVATRVGGMPESVRHEETGLLVPPADPPALAAAIERLLADRELARRLGRAGRTLMLERFTLARTGDDLSALYARLARVS
jgi:glycosyltransferase involved in cell wall biosynthesis